MEFLNFHPETEIIVIEGDEMDLINKEFLFKNTSYKDGVLNRFNFNRIIKLYYEMP